MNRSELFERIIHHSFYTIQKKVYERKKREDEKKKNSFMEATK